MKLVQTLIVIVLAFTMQAESKAQDGILSEYEVVKSNEDKSSSYVIYKVSHTRDCEVDKIYKSIGYFKQIDEKLFKVNQKYWLKAFLNPDNIISVPVNVSNEYSSIGFTKKVKKKYFLVKYSSITKNLKIEGEKMNTETKFNINLLILVISTLLFALLLSGYKNQALAVIILLLITTVIIVAAVYVDEISGIFSILLLIIAVLGYGLVNVFDSKKWSLFISFAFHVFIVGLIAIHVEAIFEPIIFIIFLIWFIFTSIFRQKLFIHYFKKYEEEMNVEENKIAKEDS